MEKTGKYTKEEVSAFMEGHDPEERIVNMEYNYTDDFIKVYYRNENDDRCMSQRPFYPFLWATEDACRDLKQYVHDKKICGGNLRTLMSEYGINVKLLKTSNLEGQEIESMKNGYKFMFFAEQPMSNRKFQEFFKKAGNPIYSNKKDENTTTSVKKKRQYLVVTPVEQYLISTGKRFFKGYSDYDEVLRMIFDLEATGLDTTKDRINQFGIRFNRPVKYKGEYIDFEKVYEVEGKTEEERDKSEYLNIRRFLSIIMTFQPDIITAHNGENFDWNLIIGALKRLGYNIEDLSKEYFDGQPLYKSAKETILKLGGEIEKFYPTIVPRTIITDSLHAVRRAQAIDSNMLRADLKYATKYAKMVKPNRVYVKGDLIDDVWRDEREVYAFNDEDGDWYEITEEHPLKEGYVVVSGHYIVLRYLLDDLWECDKVELKYNTTNFLICKILPIPFGKCCTMGTAGQWKALLMAWSYENGLAIPMAEDSGKFTGGLSRLLCTGYVKNVIKLDYNSLYPSIILTWGIEDEKDLSHAMLNFLEYVLTTREQSKSLKKKAGKIVDAYEERINNGEKLTKKERKEYEKAQSDYAFNDKKQAQQKVLGNSFFGSYGSNNGSVFPWKSVECAERTTCTGRQSLRLMISHFAKLGYKPIVGDSFSKDTPVFIKYNSNGWIDIKPISELINEQQIKVDEFGREYDYSQKDYKVLCRSGWVEPSYIYRHKTDKDIYEVTDGDTMVEVTEDHSLFNSNREKIKPSEISEKTELEYYSGNIIGDDFSIQAITVQLMRDVHNLAEGKIDRVPVKVLNCYNKKVQRKFYETFMENYHDDINYSKTCLAGLQYIKRTIESV